MTSVRGSRVLIVEDEYLIAHDISRYFQRMGAIILGPSANVASAIENIAFADAAILDIDLNGETVFGLADELVQRKVPFVFFSGRSDISIPQRFQHAGRLAKPANAQALCEELFPGEFDEGAEIKTTGTVFEALPKLRLAALVLMEEEGSADRLVERTLQRALTSVQGRNGEIDVDEWLSALLDDTYSAFGSRLRS